ncbi:MAG TPA: YhjD/YihY/BrkB family envelope integrity protein [Micromonosporaceae bacterium]
MAQLARFVRGVVRDLRGHDLALYAAGVTFYAAIAIVPVSLLSIWLAGKLVGVARLAALGRRVVDSLPTGMGAPPVAQDLITAGLHLSPGAAVVMVLPATLYGEGLRRAFVAVIDARDRFIGWRGRLAVLPLLALAPALIAGVTLVTPVVTRLLAGTGWTLFAGIVVSFIADWLALSVALAWVYRFVGPARPALGAVALGALGTASFLSGFIHGFLLFVSIPVDLGYPFGGLTVIGGVVAVGLWLYLLHVIALVGYAVTVYLDDVLRGRTLTPSGSPATSGPTIARTS